MYIKNPAVFILMSTTGLGGTEVKLNKSERDNIDRISSVNTLYSNFHDIYAMNPRALRITWVANG